MANTDVITEKVYCNGYPNCGMDNSAAWLYSQNQWMNNPFALMLLPMMMRVMFGDDWRNRMGTDPEISSRFNQLSGQISDNHNTDIINEAVKGNTARIGELANNLNVDLRTIQTGICDLRSGIQQVSGDLKFSAERVINAAERGDSNIISKLMECCCQNKQLVQQMGYENQLAQKDLLFNLQQGHNTLGYQMQSGFDRTNTGLERGFSAIAYESQRQTCDIVNAVNAAQQRTADLLNSHWKDELSKENLILRNRIDNYEQNDKIVDRIAQRFGDRFGCGCAG